MKTGRPRLMHLAVALMAGLAMQGNESRQYQMGHNLMQQLRLSYMRANAGKRSNAATQQRAAQKRRNIRARASKRA